MLWLALAGTARAADARPVHVLSSPDELKSAFLSGQPWLLQCVSKEDLAAAPTDTGVSPGLHAVVERALSALPPECSVGVLDCQQKLPSGKNTFERFKLDSGISPTLVFAANSRTPLQITSDLLNKQGLAASLFPSVRKQAAALVALVKAKIEPKAYILTKTEHFQARCLRRKHCAMVLQPRQDLRAEDSATVGRLMREFRDVEFVT